MPRPPEPPGDVVIRQLIDKGIRDARVLDAMSRVPRKCFLPPATREHALDDRAVEIGCNQTISQPYVVAVMTMELALSGSEWVLEIGTGSRYQTSVFSHMAKMVFTIERFAELSLRARGILDGLGLANIHFRIGEGSLGWSEEPPFDRIIVTAAAPELPRSLFRQPAEGGLLVAPIGDDELQQITVVRKMRRKPIAREILPCRFVRLIGREGWREGN